MVCMVILAGTATCQPDAEEAALKAAFIYNFTKYIDWEAVPDNEPFVIGILGPSEIETPLNKIAAAYKAKNKQIIIKNFGSPEKISACQMLFIPAKQPFAVETILANVNKGTLTISESAGFAKMGTAFNFIIVNNKLKFEANLKAINTAGLKASSQLLKLAVIVD